MNNVTEFLASNGKGSFYIGQLGDNIVIRVGDGSRYTEIAFDPTQIPEIIACLAGKAIDLAYSNGSMAASDSAHFGSGD